MNEELMKLLDDEGLTFNWDETFGEWWLDGDDNDTLGVMNAPDRQTAEEGCLYILQQSATLHKELDDEQTWKAWRETTDA